MQEPTDDHRKKIGILGCGSIGSRIADAIVHQFQHVATLSGVHDINHDKAASLSLSLDDPSLTKLSLEELITASDLIVEAVNSPITFELINQIIEAKKDVLVMSVGQLLLHEELLSKAALTGSRIIIPSGAIAGIDAIKAGRIIGIDEISITTRKPVKGLLGAPYLKKQGIDLSTITTETEVFSGTVHEAVEAFPQNINVAATIALAANAKNFLRIRIVTSPEFKYNTHEVCVKGKFGEITTVTKNTACPDNPKTSYLAALSGIAALLDFYENIKIGT